VRAQQPLSTAAATEPCVRSLPRTNVGLPPSRPSGDALWVYRATPDRVLPRTVARLYAYHGANGRWQGLILTFFKSESRARAYAKSFSYGRHRIVRNVIVETDTPAASWQMAVLACLRGGTPDPLPAPRPSPHASLATFVGYWGGHTRGLQVSSAGEGSERVNDGCCIRVYDLSFQILYVTGTLTSATATYRVTRFKRYPNSGGPTMHVGQVGRLRLRNGIVTDRESDTNFCSDPAWEATGACGA
jgi:hypothetical protein